MIAVGKLTIAQLQARADALQLTVCHSLKQIV